MSDHTTSATIGGEVTGDYRCKIHAQDWWMPDCIHCVKKRLERTEQVLSAQNERVRSLQSRGVAPEDAIALLRGRRSPAVLCNPVFHDWLLR